MIEIKVGEPLQAYSVKRGESGKGKWELIKIIEEHGKKSITVWNKNPPSQVVEGGAFRVDSIDSISYKSRKVNDKWYEDISVNGLVTALSRTYTPPPVPEKPVYVELGQADGELPF